jgi:hypothetical protein
VCTRLSGEHVNSGAPRALREFGIKAWTRKIQAMAEGVKKIIHVAWHLGAPHGLNSEGSLVASLIDLKTKLP